MQHKKRVNPIMYSSQREREILQECVQRVSEARNDSNCKKLNIKKKEIIVDCLNTLHRENFYKIDYEHIVNYVNNHLHHRPIPQDNQNQNQQNQNNANPPLATN